MARSMPTEEEQKAGTADYTVCKDKKPTDLQERFADWIVEKVGVDPSKDFSTKGQAFAAGVQYATMLRMPFQRSPENKTATANKRVARSVEEAPAAPVKAAGKRAGRKAAAEPVAAAEKPAGRRRGAAAKAVAAPVAPAAPAKATGRRRGRATGAASPEEAAF